MLSLPLLRPLPSPLSPSHLWSWTHTYTHFCWDCSILVCSQGGTRGEGAPVSVYFVHHNVLRARGFSTSCCWFEQIDLLIYTVTKNWAYIAAYGHLFIALLYSSIALAAARHMAVDMRSGQKMSRHFNHCPHLTVLQAKDVWSCSCEWLLHHLEKQRS